MGFLLRREEGGSKMPTLRYVIYGRPLMANKRFLKAANFQRYAQITLQQLKKKYLVLNIDT